MIGDGEAPDGRWQLRALALDRALYFQLDFWNRRGWRSGGGAVGGVGLANDDRPVVLSMSRPGVETSYWYIGQAIDRTTRIEFTLTNGTCGHGLLLRHVTLPVQLWVVVIDNTAAPTVFRGFAGDEMLDEFEIAERWPLPSGNLLWGPVDE